MALPVILDCDPGHDDAIALILALASPELKVLAVTTSAGNQTPDKTLNNALRILTLLGRDDIPVAAGAPKPLARELIIADNVHGESGLDGPKLPDPAFAPQAMTGLELMAKCLRESPEPVTLVPTGPLTNIALLLAAHPELKGKIARIVLMGGTAGAGNWTPAAEFNIYVDPEAADMVFKSGIPITMCGRAARLFHDLPSGSQVGICWCTAPRPLYHCLVAGSRAVPRGRVPGRYRDQRGAYRGDDGGGSLWSDRQASQCAGIVGAGSSGLY